MDVAHKAVAINTVRMWHLSQHAKTEMYCWLCSILSHMLYSSSRCEYYNLTSLQGNGAVDASVVD